MRFILFLLFALAIGKVGTQAYIRQESAKNTIIDAYRERAVAACRKHIGGPGTRTARYNPRTHAYRQNSGTQVSLDLMIGNKDIDVRLWQTSHSNWSARYRDPFILVKAPGSDGLTVCEYDIKNGTVYARTREQASRNNS